MSRSTVAKWRAVILTVAPTVLLAGFLYHPHFPLLDSAAVAAAVTADPTRWAIAHLLVAVGSGLAILAFIALRGHIRESGEEWWSAGALPFIVMGSTLFTMLPAMEFSVLAANKAGTDPAAIQTALDTWFVPTLITGAALFALGALGFAAAIVRSGVLARPATWLVAAALVVMAVARFVPIMTVQFHVQGAAGIAAFWPLAYVMWRREAVP